MCPLIPHPDDPSVLQLGSSNYYGAWRVAGLIGCGGTSNVIAKTMTEMVMATMILVWALVVVQIRAPSKQATSPMPMPIPMNFATTTT